MRVISCIRPSLSPPKPANHAPPPFPVLPVIALVHYRIVRRTYVGRALTHDGGIIYLIGGPRQQGTTSS